MVIDRSGEAYGAVGADVCGMSRQERSACDKDTDEIACEMSGLEWMKGVSKSVAAVSDDVDTV